MKKQVAVLLSTLVLVPALAMPASAKCNCHWKFWEKPAAPVVEAPAKKEVAPIKAAETAVKKDVTKVETTVKKAGETVKTDVKKEVKKVEAVKPACHCAKKACPAKKPCPCAKKAPAKK